MADVDQDPDFGDDDSGNDDSEAEATVAGIDVRQLEAMSEDPFLAGPPSLGDFVSQMNGSPGFVVDPAIARESTCIGYQLRRDAPPDAEPDLVFAKGYVVDPAIARESTCIGYQLRRDAPPDAEPDLVFAKGVVGALDRDQVEMFCPTIQVRPLSDAQRDRLTAFTQAAQTCKVQVADLPSGDRLDPYLGCMSAELHQRGQRL
jgi:hypothetical protein